MAQAFSLRLFFSSDPVAAPFALADLLSPDMMAILLQLSGN